MEKDRKSKTELEFGMDFEPEERQEVHRQKEYWQQFLHTGRITDYLTYAQVSQQENTPMRLR